MGILMSYIGWILIVITVAVIFLYKRMTKDPEALTSKYKATKIINIDRSKSLNLIKQALENLGFKNVTLNKEGNAFYAKTKFSMSSWTEQIEVKVDENNNETEITFMSICSLPTQIFDWGKNKRNYRKFERELDKLLNENY